MLCIGAYDYGPVLSCVAWLHSLTNWLIVMEAAKRCNLGVWRCEMFVQTRPEAIYCAGIILGIISTVSYYAGIMGTVFSCSNSYTIVCPR